MDRSSRLLRCDTVQAPLRATLMCDLTPLANLPHPRGPRLRNGRLQCMHCSVATHYNGAVIVVSVQSKGMRGHYLRPVQFVWGCDRVGWCSNDARATCVCNTRHQRTVTHNVVTLVVGCYLLRLGGGHAKVRVCVFMCGVVVPIV